MFEAILEAMTRCRSGEKIIAAGLDNLIASEPIPEHIVNSLGGAEKLKDSDAVARVLAEEAVPQLRHDYESVTKELYTYSEIAVGGGENPTSAMEAYELSHNELKAQSQFREWLAAKILRCRELWQRLKESATDPTGEAAEIEETCALQFQVLNHIYNSLFPDDPQVGSKPDVGGDSPKLGTGPTLVETPRKTEDASERNAAAQSQADSTRRGEGSTGTRPEPKSSGKEVRGADGRFVKGNAGGPGRPRRNAQERYYDAVLTKVSAEDLGDVLASLVEAGKKGDTKAAGLLLRHFLPKGKDLMSSLTLTECTGEGASATVPEAHSESAARIVSTSPPTKQGPGDSGAFKRTG